MFHTADSLNPLPTLFYSSAKQVSERKKVLCKAGPGAGLELGAVVGKILALSHDILCPMVQVSSISTLWSSQESFLLTGCNAPRSLQLRVQDTQAPSWERVLIQPDLGSATSICINLRDNLTLQGSISLSGKWAQCEPLHAGKL